jgi:hypothetical protein
MNELKGQLGLDEWLELIKEDKNLSGAYFSIAQYVYLIEKENQQLKIQISAREEEYRKLEREFQELKLINKEYERLNKENGKGFKIISIRQYNIDELIRYKDNWNKLKSFLKNTREEHLELDKKHNCEWKGYNAYSELLIKIQELERGVDDEQR